MTFLELRIAGWKARVKFEREYKMTIEKVFDTKSQRMFWYNHVTKASVWEQPKLIRRYGDVEKPFPWVVNEEDTCIVIPDSEGGDGETTYKNINYYNICTQTHYSYEKQIQTLYTYIYAQKRKKKEIYYSYSIDSKNSI